MRVAYLPLLLSAALLSLVHAAPPVNPKADAKIQTAAAARPTDAITDGSAEGTTVFNGQEVPPMKQLSGEALDEDISKGYWYAKHGQYPPQQQRILTTFLTTGLSNSSRLTATTAKPWRRRGRPSTNSIIPPNHSHPPNRTPIHSTPSPGITTSSSPSSTALRTEMPAPRRMSAATRQSYCSKTAKR